jgi:hypothetical protein
MTDTSLPFRPLRTSGADAQEIVADRAGPVLPPDDAARFAPCPRCFSLGSIGLPCTTAGCGEVIP